MAKLIELKLIDPDMFMYVPHIFDERFFGELGSQLLTDTIANSRLSVPAPKNDSLRKFVGGKGEDFIKATMTKEKIADLLQEHVVRQSRYIFQHDGMIKGLDDLVKNPNVDAELVPISKVARNEAGELGFVMDDGRIVTGDTHRFSVPDESFRKAIHLSDEERLLLERSSKALESRQPGILDDLDEAGEAAKVADEARIAEIEGLRVQDFQNEIHRRIGEVLQKNDGTTLVNTRRTMAPVERANAGEKMVYVIPKNAAHALDNALGLNIYKPLGVEWLFDTPTRLWRDMVLGLAPRWIINNAAGNFVMNSVDGVRLKDYFDWAFDPRYNKYIPEDAVGAASMRTEFVGKEFARTLPAEQSFFGRVFRDRPIVQSLSKEASEEIPGVFGKIVRAPINVVRKVKDAMVNFNDEVERFSRGARAVREVKRIAKERVKKVGSDMIGMEAALAQVLDDVSRLDDAGRLLSDDAVRITNAVQDTLFDYSNLTSVEKNLIRKLFPFWTWHKNITRTVIMMPDKHPIKVLMAKKLADIGNPEYDDSRPDWLRGAILVGYADDGDAIYYNLRGMNPYLDAVDISGGKILSSMNPLIKVGLEQLSGRDFFRERQFTDSTTYHTFGGRSYRFNEQTGHAEPVVVRPNIFMHLARQTPQGQILEDFLAEMQGVRGLRQDVSTFLEPLPVLDSKGQPIEFKSTPSLDKLSGLMLGGRFLRVDEAEQAAKRQKLDKRARQRLFKELQKQRAFEQNK
jgi:hypothetical protein